MTRRHRRPMPTWFVALVALALWSVVRVTQPADAPAHPPVLYAWWGVVVMIAQAIWTGIEAAGQATLVAVHWAVVALWSVVSLIHNAALELGRGFMRGFQVSWGFLKSAYGTILQPGWSKFWGWVDRARAWLENFFAPAYRFLRFVRDEVLAFYDHWVRPILDSIDIARKVLGVLRTFGFEWAIALDNKLAELERKIYEPFQFVLAKINEAIGVLDQVVTAGGLFQRLALIRSIERDLRYVWRAMANWRHFPLGPEDYTRMRKLSRTHTLEQVQHDTEEAIETGGGRYGPIIEEMSVQWRLYLKL